MIVVVDDDEVFDLVGYVEVVFEVGVVVVGMYL